MPVELSCSIHAAWCVSVRLAVKSTSALLRDMIYDLCAVPEYRHELPLLQTALTASNSLVLFCCCTAVDS